MSGQGQRATYHYCNRCGARYATTTGHNCQLSRSTSTQRGNSNYRSRGSSGGVRSVYSGYDVGGSVSKDMSLKAINGMIIWYLIIWPISVFSSFLKGIVMIVSLIYMFYIFQSKYRSFTTINGEKRIFTSYYWNLIRFEGIMAIVAFLVSIL